jgi:hypothetical protein
MRFVPKALLTLAVTAMAFALFGANARAATVLQAGSTKQTTVHLPEGSTIPTPMAGLLCSPGTCGVIDFTAGATGVFTASVSFPTDFAQVDLVLCQQGATPTSPFDTTCPMGSAEVPCARTQIVNANGTTTVTIRCDVIQGATYTLLVVPNFIFVCGIDPTCSGLDVLVTYGITAGSGTGSGGGGGVPNAGKVSGGGKVDGGASPFSLMAIADPNRYDQGHVKYMGKVPNTCTFIATSITFVTVTALPSSQGEADVWGYGYINGNKSNPVPYHVHVTDGGEGNSNQADAFDLKAGPNSTRGGNDSSPACSTATPNVVHGNTQILPTA